MPCGAVVKTQKCAITASCWCEGLVSSGGPPRGVRLDWTGGYRSRGTPETAPLEPLRARNEYRIETRQCERYGHHVQGSASRAAQVHPQGLSSTGNRKSCELHLPRSSSGDLGRGNNRVRLRLEEVRSMGPKPHDGVAYPLRWSWCHDLLAC